MTDDAGMFPDWWDTAAGTYAFPVEHRPGQRSLGGVGRAGNGDAPLPFPHFPARANQDPRQLPELRSSLLDFSMPGSAWEASEIQRSVMGLQSFTKGYGPKELQEVVHGAVEAGRNQCYWYRRNLPDAQLIHVTHAMTDVIESAATNVPEDYVLQQSDVPTPVGLVVFERPIWGRGYMEAIEWREQGDQDAVEQVDIRVDALMWGMVRLPPSNESGMWWTDEDVREMGRVSLGIAAFRYMHPDHDDETAKRFFSSMEKRPVWMPLGRTDWPLGERLDLPTHAGLGEKLWETMMDDRRIALSLWSIIQQKLLVEQTVVHADRPARKRLERKNHPTSPVQVIHLRRPEYRPQQDHEATGRHVTKRFPVRPFWRMQAYGPNHSLRRLQLIPPHWRGPVDGEVIHTERIWEVDR